MDNIQSIQPKRKNSVSAYLGIVISLVILVFIFLTSSNNRFPFAQPSSPPVSRPMSTRLPNPPVIDKFFTFQGCDIKKDDNPLVEGVNSIGTNLVGTFYGNINKIDFQPTKSAASIEIISPKGEQAYDFNVHDESGLVYDAIALKNLKLADLSQGQTVDISFNCFPKLNNQFKITKISVVGK